MRPNEPGRLPVAAGLALVLALLGGVSACGDRGAAAEPGSTLTTDEFVAVVVEIREAEREIAFSDSAREIFETRKREILERHGTSEEDLQRFLTERREDIGFLRDLWDTLNVRLRHVPPRHDPAAERPVPLLED